ncbi:hypothetical protein DL93DRAFT_1161075 [Clavulina sp. PMI_390]|nr:hypothetical protein DL93DRAFT_1161075 [Clavulina sp. PMI_390]
MSEDELGFGKPPSPLNLNSRDRVSLQPSFKSSVFSKRIFTASSILHLWLGSKCDEKLAWPHIFVPSANCSVSFRFAARPSSGPSSLCSSCPKTSPTSGAYDHPTPFNCPSYSSLYPIDLPHTPTTYRHTASTRSTSVSSGPIHLLPDIRRELCPVFSPRL